ncbi:hypothetical protein ACIREM_15430 [Streptomyces shenzhenensis]|uniref:hypothetical protein n=1 Tax=Streptomyces shenzhenensis TaxID=943815 RepID=UPI0037F41FE9
MALTMPRRRAPTRPRITGGTPGARQKALRNLARFGLATAQVGFRHADRLTLG